MKTVEDFQLFMDGVEAYFARRNIPVTINIEGTVTPHDGVMTYGLSNLVQTCAQYNMRDADILRARIAEHFDTMLRTSDFDGKRRKQLEDWEFAMPRLRVRLWDMDTGPFLKSAVTSEDIPGLATTLSVDFPESVDSVSQEAAKKWRCGETELLRIALGNTLRSFSAEAKQIDAERFGPMQVVEAESFYSSAAALDIERYPDLLGPRGAFITIPTRPQVFALPVETAGDMRFVSELVRFTRWCFEMGPGSVSQRLWWYREGKWLAVAYDADGPNITIKPPEELQSYLEEMGLWE